MTCSRGCCATQAEHYKSIAFDSKSAMESEKKKNEELRLYAQARAEGSQPWGTTTKQSLQALRESDKLGRPFEAHRLGHTYHPEIDRMLRPLPKEAKDAARAESGTK